MKQTLLSLISAYGATGRETNVANIIRGMVEPYVDSITTDAMGNLIATRKGQPGGKRIMLAAHMDHIGFVVIGVEEKGFLRVSNVGGISRNNSFTRRVVFENGVSGVLSHEIQDFNAGNFTMDKMFIDIGAKTREEAEAMVDIGDVAVYAPDIFEMGDRVVGPAMDDRAGCAIVVETLKALKDPKNEVIAAFTVQEEVGMRGAWAAAYSVNPDVGIALDVTMCGDTPKGIHIAVNLGEGIAIKVMDSSVVCTPCVVDALIAAAERSEAKYQREVLVGGGTDTTAIQLTRGGIPSGAISIPCRYVHSAAETIDMNDFEAGVKTLVSFIENY